MNSNARSRNITPTLTMIIVTTITILDAHEYVVAIHALKPLHLCNPFSHVEKAKPINGENEGVFKECRNKASHACLQLTLVPALFAQCFSDHFIQCREENHIQPPKEIGYPKEERPEEKEYHRLYVRHRHRRGHMYIIF
ncbi:hypothetical protein PanWU01x14_106580 [Parasponia andersonii]|uniref:Uncharacterized protein n=1 Tax=Parasponia andersonii TaxID=3476 RepID=A0A2P5D0P8_PARAD|nr:hypothetical protein PanWU01x14_106580 [Parasponia andersonii]